MPVDPFTDERVRDLLQTEDQSGVLHVLTREGTTKEFKENFTWGSIGLYARTMAAFANARGGYIIFGVTDNPRVAVGLKGDARDAFDNIDQAKLTQDLNDLFSPEVRWELGLFERFGRTFGAIYAFESEDKPVVARKSYQKQNANLVEGDIVYRYNSRTERAKFPELKKILDDAKTREQRAMMRHIDELVKAGASHAAVLDFHTSTLQGPSGQKVLIDEELLKQISFIREGEFDEVKGAPALKVVGQVQAAKTLAISPERVVRSSITTEDVLKDFLEQRKVGDEGKQYIRQVTSGTTSFLPIHYYASAAGLDHDQLIEFVEAIPTRAVAKRKVLERLRANDKLQTIPPTHSTQYISTVFRRQYYDKLVDKDLEGLDLDDVESAQYFLEAVKSLNDQQIRDIFKPLIALMKGCFGYYTDNANVAEAIRRSSCRVDAAMFNDA